jgi:ELWxxDGT repeat protein
VQLSDDAFVFAANDGTDAGRRSLWRSDGTAEGTIKLSDVVPYGSESNRAEFARVGDTLLFFVAAGTDRELWKTDGTPQGTVRVKDMRLGLGESESAGLVAAGDRVFFRANDPVYGPELWTSDGTADGTHMVKETVPGFRWPEPLIAGVIGNVVFLKAEDRLWKSDGTSEGTVLVKDVNQSQARALDWLMPLQPFTHGGYLYFMGLDDEHGRELWRSDGTAAGTVPLPDVYPGFGSAGYPGTGLGPPIFVNGRMYFAASDGEHGVELWQYAKPGDANRDFRVDFADLVILAQNYNGTGKTHDQGDFTGDGRTDFADLVVLAQNYSAAPAAPSAALPAARSSSARSASSRDAERKSIFSMTPVTKRPPLKRARVQ